MTILTCAHKKQRRTRSRHSSSRAGSELNLREQSRRFHLNHKRSCVPLSVVPSHFVGLAEEVGQAFKGPGMFQCNPQARTGFVETVDGREIAHLPANRNDQRFARDLTGNNRLGSRKRSGINSRFPLGFGHRSKGLRVWAHELKVFMRKHLGSLSQIETALAKDGIAEGVVVVTPSLESSGTSDAFPHAARVHPRAGAFEHPRESVLESKLTP